MRYTVIRSSRKTLAIQIKHDGTVIVRAPYKMSDSRIRAFVEEKKNWIEGHLAKLRAGEQKLPTLAPYTAQELRLLADKAMQIIPERVRHYAPLVGVDYGRITIRNQRTRWGSCSGKGNLNFNCLLVLLPPEVLDSVVVHELCHRKHMDHSAAFYAEVRRAFPAYDRCRLWLKENGAAYLRRLG